VADRAQRPAHTRGEFLRQEQRLAGELGHRLQARGLVDRRPDHVEGQPVGRADVGMRDGAEVQAEAEGDFAQAGVPAVAGLRTALACVAALRRAPGDAARIRAIGAVARPAAPGEWLDEASAKVLIRDTGIAVPPGRVAEGEEDAALVAADLGGPVALKRVDPELRHKARAGALVLGAEGERAVREAYRGLNGCAGGRVLVEAMAPPGVELLVSARRDAVVPVVTVGLGGVWTEALRDAAVVPLPARPDRVERALRSLRAAPLLEAADLPAAAAVAARAGELLLEHDLELLELNPVIVHRRGAVAVDAVARRAVPETLDQEGPPES